MLRKIAFAISLVIISSTYSYAAEELNKQPLQVEKTSSISLSRNIVSPEDANNQIHAIAEKRGADYYIINSLVNAGRNGGGLRVSAEFYNG